MSGKVSKPAGLLSRLRTYRVQLAAYRDGQRGDVCALRAHPHRALTPDIADIPHQGHAV